MLKSNRFFVPFTYHRSFYKVGLQERAFMLVTFKSMKEMVARKACFVILDGMKFYMKTLRTELYDRLGLSKDLSHHVSTDFVIYTIHMWATHKVNRSRGKIGEVMSDHLCTEYWRREEMDGFVVRKFSALLIKKNLTDLQHVHYALMRALDLITSQGVENKDKKFAELINRYVYQYQENGVRVNKLTSIRQLEWWVNYINYVESYLDSLPEDVFTSGQFEFQDPSSDFVSNNNLYITVKDPLPDRLYD
ncbi:ubiquinol-cytochrome-c reductase complex assembly factor 1 [Acrasis kona]|uniref:Ubiquinol-cytochrome-c reductase complex assembly factor 1 n=1 Tax=Acrasis kona TaxID=1008807 RepID=A0AAW2ZHY4_9EUKA